MQSPATSNIPPQYSLPNFSDSPSNPLNSLSHLEQSLNSRPSSSTRSATEHTFTMSQSPVMRRRHGSEGSRPKIISTIGQRPACLVSASVTYVGSNELYAFGGFDQFTDEVYNHVLRLNLETRQWNLVDNYGDIPGVRMGHTACLWQGDKVLIFGGENEHRAYLNDLIIFDIKTAHWQQPELYGQPPRGRARHAAVIHDEKLFIIGGLSGSDNSTILDDFSFLDLRTWTWSRTWRLVPRFDHMSWIWNGRLWIFGGLTEGMEKVGDLVWLDLKYSPIFSGDVSYQTPTQRHSRSPLHGQVVPQGAGTTGYTANSGSVQVGTGSHSVSRRPPLAPGSITSVSFVSGPQVPSQASGTHFHAFSSGCLVDFATPGVTSSPANPDTSLYTLELDSMRWERVAEGRELFDPSYRWQYCALDQDGTKAWLLGCPTDPQGNTGANGGEYLSHVLSLDLRKVGLLGNDLASQLSLEQPNVPNSDSQGWLHLTGIGADLAKKFDKSPETGSGANFIITAEPDEGEDENDTTMTQNNGSVTRVSQPIHVHRLILEARWPHFARMLSAQMAEFHTKKLHIPEPYSVVRAFLFYLYTDSIHPHPEFGPSLEEVAGMLVISNCYDMPRLRLLCRNRLGKELDVDHAAVIWERAGTADEEWLKRRAARFCMTHWGRVVRTAGFQSLRRLSMMELCQEVDTEGRIVGADELETVGGLGGARFGSNYGWKDRRSGVSAAPLGDEVEDVDDEEGMELS